MRPASTRRHDFDAVAPRIRSVTFMSAACDLLTRTFTRHSLGGPVGGLRTTVAGVLAGGASTVVEPPVTSPQMNAYVVWTSIAGDAVTATSMSAGRATAALSMKPGELPFDFTSFTTCQPPPEPPQAATNATRANARTAALPRMIAMVTGLLRSGDSGGLPTTRRRIWITVVAMLACFVVGVMPPALSAASPSVSVTIRGSGLTVSRSTVPVGSVVFVVTNEGTAPQRLGVKGEMTAPISHGGRAILRVRFTRAGSYRVTASGLRTGRTLTVIAPTPSPSPAPQRPSSTGGSPQPCTNPTSSTVTVTMTDAFGPAGYSFSPASVPCGMVTFVLNNIGANEHGLGLKSPIGVEAPASPSVDSHQSAVLAANLSVKGVYQWWDSEGEGFETTYGTLVVG